MAERIPGAKCVELPGIDHMPWVGDSDAMLDEVEQFLTGARRARAGSRARHGAVHRHRRRDRARRGLGDREWRDLLRELRSPWSAASSQRFRGREINTAGDGFLATFDGPARAIRCACAIARRVRRSAGCPRRPAHGRVRGDRRRTRRHRGAHRRAGGGGRRRRARSWSRAVQDLVAGSGLAFEDRGTHGLKGVPGQRRLDRFAG